jgi:hypothetical protein
MKTQAEHGRTSAMRWDDAMMKTVASTEGEAGSASLLHSRGERCVLTVTE